MRNVMKVFLFAMLLAIFSSHSAFATAISITTNPGGPGAGDGGFAAVAEYGSDYVLASLQGDYPLVFVNAKLDYYYNISAGGNVNITYSVSAEMTTYDGGWLSGNVGVGIYKYNSSLHGIWPGDLLDSASINNTLFTTGHFEDSINDQQTNISSWSSNSYQLHIGMYAFLNGSSRDTHEGPDSWYSGTMYADPIVTLNGTVIDPIGGYYTVTREALYLGEEWQDEGQDEGTTDPVPEPATMILLGTGLVGVAGAARRRIKPQA